MSKSARARRSALGCRRGAAAAEFAIISIFFFVGMLATIDVGRFYMTLQGVRNFAADASRYGIARMTNGQTLCRGALVTAMGRGGVVGGLVSTNPGVCVTRTESSTGGVKRIIVTVTTDVTFSFVVNVFGVGNQRIQDSTTIDFLL